MTIAVNGSTLSLDVETVLLWVLVGLVPGFLASHLALGHGLGLFWDIVVGILGGLFGGIVLVSVDTHPAELRVLHWHNRPRLAS